MLRVELKITVRGRSMFPTLADGDVVEVRLCGGDQARIGDVVLVMIGKLTVLHRVIGRSGNELVTQGDGVRWPDDPVPLERVLGIAETRRRATFARWRAAKRKVKLWISRTLRSARRSRPATR